MESPRLGRSRQEEPGGRAEGQLQVLLGATRPAPAAPSHHPARSESTFCWVPRRGAPDRAGDRSPEASFPQLHPAPSTEEGCGPCDLAARGQGRPARLPSFRRLLHLPTAQRRDQCGRAWLGAQARPPILRWQERGGPSGQPAATDLSHPALFPSQVHGYKGVKFQNWARTYGCCPEMYYQPTSVEEIREVSVHPGLETRPCLARSNLLPTHPPPQNCWPGESLRKPTTVWAPGPCFPCSAPREN